MLSPNFSTGDPIGGIDKWMQHIKNYEASSGDKLPDAVKVTVLMKTVNESLCTQLQMNVGTEAIVDVVVKNVEGYSRPSKQSAYSSNVPTKSTMDYYRLLRGPDGG